MRTGRRGCRLGRVWWEGGQKAGGRSLAFTGSRAGAPIQTRGPHELLFPLSHSASSLLPLYLPLLWKQVPEACDLLAQHQHGRQVSRAL